MQSTKDFLFNFFSQIKQKGFIDEKLINDINSIFSNKAERVLEVMEKGITKYIYKPSNRVIWTAMGENCEHIIYPKLFCSCRDFYKNVVIKRKRDYCKHILAQIISEALNDYKTLELNDQEFTKLIDDLELNY
ncbi:MAG: SWIM zinc finger family protein [Promethearchaeota archaeon]